MADFIFGTNTSDDLRGSAREDMFWAGASNPPLGFSTLSSSDRASGGEGTDRIILTVSDIVPPGSAIADATRCDVSGFTLDSIEEMELRVYDSDGDKNHTNAEVLLGMMNVTGLQKVLSSSSTANVTLDYLNELVAMDIKGNGIRGTSFTLNYTSAVNVRPPVIFSQPLMLTSFGDRNSGPGTITVDAVTGFSIITQGRASTIILNGQQATTLDLDLRANLTLQQAGLPGLQVVNGLPAMTGALSINLQASLKDLKITTGLGADFIQTGGGADSISSGDGNDRVLPGLGQDMIELGSGNDTVQFSYRPETRLSGLSLADRIAGGDGIDRVGFIPGDTIELNISDRFFRNWSGIEVLDVSTARASVSGRDLPDVGGVASVLSLGAKAAAQGLQSVVTGAGNDSIIVSAFDKPLLIELSGGIDHVDARKAGNGRLEILVRDAFLDESDALMAGSGNDDLSYGDELRIVASGSTATLRQVTGFERISLVMDEKNLASTRLITSTELIVYNDVIAKGKTLAVDASRLQGTGNYAGLTFDGSREIDGGFDMTGSGGIDALKTGDARDNLAGASGNDRLKGGAGIDTLTGGSGRDRFFYTDADKGADNKDVVSDFTPGEDLLVVGGTGGNNVSTRISDLVFIGNEDTERGASQKLSSSQSLNDGALSVVFVTETETLWIDLDENGQLDDQDIQIELTGISELSRDDFSIGGFQ